MSTKLIKKYVVKGSAKKSGGDFLSLAKSHAVKKKGVEKNLAASVDKILYGKR